ncbi:endonuclease/exonuclease/phosphatase family protein [Carboxylicivirga sp. N1Y90]|uniref:endonuclease/exonuclease/phosphatase family protein n=1 Tax=Carboxylicivirga fragile TaxID=3417571 RepID=UPI003D3382B1|nr:endonuclease/exonuclease/phosphatase family protein [Marinilabiliaceae bacterium N1Y90]
MKIPNHKLIYIFLLFMFVFCACNSLEEEKNRKVFNLDFNGSKGLRLDKSSKKTISLKDGVENQALDLRDKAYYTDFPDSSRSLFSMERDFSIGIWLKSDQVSKDTTLILANTDFAAQKTGYYGYRRINKGFALYNCNGSWGWNIGNGNQNFLYEPIANDQPINDKEWHCLVFTHKADKHEISLYYDGVNRAILRIGDLVYKDFMSDLSLCLGSDPTVNSSYNSFNGMVDEFTIWSKVLSKDEVKQLYGTYKKTIQEPVNESDEFTVLNWNIWHGATHYSKEKDGFDGIERTIELIRQSEADIVLMQETYGAGSKISSHLGYYYYEAASCIGAVWGANLSVMSRYPLEETYLLEEKSNYGRNYAFNNGGVKVRMNKDKRVIAFTNWYNGQKPEDLEGALKAWSSLINQADSMPVIFGGDYNSVSHLDDGIGKSGHSKLMTDAGFIDSYRACYPIVKTHPGYSFHTSKERIDYIYFKGANLELLDVRPIIPNFKGKGKLSPGYPSDHLGIVSKFRFK